MSLDKKEPVDYHSLQRAAEQHIQQQGEKMKQNQFHQYQNLDLLLKDVFGEVFGNDNYFTNVNVKTTNYGSDGLRVENGNFVFEKAMPMVSPEEVLVELTDDALTVKFQPTKANKFVAPFTKTWAVQNVNSAEVSVKLEKGVLTVSFPQKRNQVKTPTKIKVQY